MNHHTIYMREWRRRNPEKYNANTRRKGQRGYYRRKSQLYREKHPEETKAYDAVQRALRKGTLVRPTSCSECGLSCKPEAHHHDYSKWLDVTWLCRPCHLAKNNRVQRVILDSDPRKAA
jgi:hypothetical protein